MLPARSIASITVLVLTVSVFGSASAAADDSLHQVRYTVSAETPIDADIYYRDTDPVNFAAYSHNSYEFSPKAEVLVGPGQTWVLDALLTDPYQWAMVVATSGPGPLTPNFHCTLEVDGVVVKSAAGPKGALCSLRPW